MDDRGKWKGDGGHQFSTFIFNKVTDIIKKVTGFLLGACLEKKNIYCVGLLVQPVSFDVCKTYYMNSLSLRLNFKSFLLNNSL